MDKKKKRATKARQPYKMKMKGYDEDYYDEEYQDLEKEMLRGR